MILFVHWIVFGMMTISHCCGVVASIMISSPWSNLQGLRGQMRLFEASHFHAIVLWPNKYRNKIVVKLVAFQHMVASF
jgi:hypothetical protein